MTMLNSTATSASYDGSCAIQQAGAAMVKRTLKQWQNGADKLPPMRSGRKLRNNGDVEAEANRETGERTNQVAETCPNPCKHWIIDWTKDGTF